MSWAKKLDNILSSINVSENEEDESSSDSEDNQMCVKRSSRLGNTKKTYNEVDDSGEDFSDNFDDDPDDPDYAPEKPKLNEEKNLSSEDEVDDPVGNVKMFDNPVDYEIVADGTNKQTANTQVNQSSDVAIIADDDIIEVPSAFNETMPNVRNSPRKLIIKRNQYNRNLQSTLILKSFKLISSADLVMTSYVVFDDSLSTLTNEKENTAFELCAVGKSYSSVLKDMLLIYGDLNDPVYIDIIKKSIHNEKLNVVPDFFVDPIVVKIADTVIKKNSSMKLIGIPLNGTALLNENKESTRLLLYPAISTSSEKYLKLLSICNKEVKHGKVLENCKETISLSSSGSGETAVLTGGSSNKVSSGALENVTNGCDAFNLSDSDGSAESQSFKKARMENKPKFSGKKKGVSELYLKQQNTSTITSAADSSNVTSISNSSSASSSSTLNRESLSVNGSSSLDESSSQLCWTLTTSSSAPPCSALPSDPSCSNWYPKPSSTLPSSTPFCSISNSEEDVTPLENNDVKPLASISNITTNKRQIKLIAFEKLASIQKFILKTKEETEEKPDYMVIQEMEAAAKAAYHINGPSRVYRVTLVSNEIIYAYQKID